MYDHKIKVDFNNYKRGIEYLKKLGYINTKHFNYQINKLSNNELKYLMVDTEDKEMYYCHGNNCDNCFSSCKYLNIDHAFEREEKLKRLLNIKN